MPDLSFEELVFDSGKQDPLGSLSIDVDEGQLFSVLSDDPAHLDRLEAALVSGKGVHSGKFLIDGEEIAPGKIAIAVVGKELAEPSRHSIEKLLHRKLKASRLPKEDWETRILHVLALLQIERYRERPLRDLSLSALARATLALALITAPEVLLLNQPFNTLPMSHRPEMRTLFRRLAESPGLSIILLTLDSTDALTTSDLIGVLRNRQWDQLGVPMEVYKRPASKGVASMTGECNLMTGSIVRAGAGFALVETKAGPFSAALPDEYDPEVGDKVTLMTRPECWRLERMPADENCLSGTVERVDYHGSLSRYWFRTESLMLRINEMNPRFAAPPPNELYAWIDPEDVVVLSQGLNRDMEQEET